MGRDCGYLALVSALTSGAELCLIPEIRHDLSKHEDEFKKQIADGRRYFIAIVSEGIEENSDEIAKWFEEKVGIESRVVVLGHVQRGGNPTVYDRLMAYKFVNHAIDGLLRGEEKSVICYTKSGFAYKNIREVVSAKQKLDPELLASITR